MTVVHTGRLVLRPFTDGDREPFAALNADPEVTRFLTPGGVPMDRDASDALVDRIESAWDDNGYGPWCVTLAADSSSTCIGFVGLSVPTFLPEILPAVEVGWRLGRDHWGRGYATEGGQAALRYGFEELGLDRIVSIRHRDNAASARVMDKLGLSVDRETVHPERAVPLVVTAIYRTGWRG